MTQKSIHHIKLYARELIPFWFRVALISYLVFAALDLLFPGFSSSKMNLDIFLWCVILLAGMSFIIHRTKQA